MNKKFINIFIVAILFFAFAFSVVAQTNPAASVSCPQLSPVLCSEGTKAVSGGIDANGCHLAPRCVTTTSPATGGELKERIKELRQNVTTQVKTERADIKAKRAELSNQIKDEREAAKKRLESAREEAKKATETRHAELKDKISKLRDEKKKQIATRLNEQMARLNTQWTNHFNNVLGQLSEILLKVELRAGKAEAGGKDVVAVKTAVQNAKNAIATARTAVEAQAKKTYIATFTSEKELGTAFKSAREQLHKDLFGLRDGVMKDAREAVKNALQVLKGLNF
ncbi:MAG: hypothetical protein Q7K16_00435 [Candidatus Azambacteria bacterium]|nr:hypothetical protein [Candidatus Azambacteria bacterium]